MSKIIRPPGQRNTRGGTPELWDDLLFHELNEDPASGIHVFDDFTEVGDGWVATALNSGSSTAAVVAGFGGVLEIDPGATTIQHGRQLQRGPGHVRVSSTGDLYYETLTKVTLNSVEPFFFVGLSVVDSSVLGSSSELTADGIGFVVGNADGHVDFVARSTSSTLVEVIDAPLTADAWYHLGFRVKRGGKAIPFVNCVQQHASKHIAASALPTSLLTPTIAFCGQGTIQPTMKTDWVRYANVDASPVRTAA